MLRVYLLYFFIVFIGFLILSIALINLQMPRALKFFFSFCKAKGILYLIFFFINTQCYCNLFIITVIISYEIYIDLDLF